MTTHLRMLTSALVLGLAGALTRPVGAGTPDSLPPVESLERMESWRAGVDDDAQRKVLQILCIGDSNTVTRRRQR
ncbi:MAG: hypothetical protein O2901_13620 [Verrucomicrobia bacterium]|nr:hypothetical protein [Verrucomicrobiota bacterium]